jgi:hypothetical protein
MDENLWSVRGRFNTTLEDTELVKWEVQNGELILPLCVVSLSV